MNLPLLPNISNANIFKSHDNIKSELHDFLYKNKSMYIQDTSGKYIGSIYELKVEYKFPNLEKDRQTYRRKCYVGFEAKFTADKSNVLIFKHTFYINKEYAKKQIIPEDELSELHSKMFHHYRYRLDSRFKILDQSKIPAPIIPVKQEYVTVPTDIYGQEIKVGDLVVCSTTKGLNNKPGIIAGTIKSISNQGLIEVLDTRKVNETIKPINNQVIKISEYLNDICLMEKLSI